MRRFSIVFLLFAVSGLAASWESFSKCAKSGAAQT